MSRIVIKKRIALDFIVEDYKDCYLEFKTIPMKDYEIGVAIRTLETPDSEFTQETYSTLCKNHNPANVK